mgnify:FL=1|tara:strand:+ start:258 stop:812 length:555 start_codon:yes stop_codon:yes gene_type:complete
MNLPNKKYNIIYADPPWHYGSKSAVNNTLGKTIKPLSNHYQTMTLNELKKLPIKKITKKDTACFMWVTDSHIDEALEILKSWGFKYKTIAFNWIKTTSKGNYCKNVAPWTMKSSEICLLGIKGKMTKYKKINNIESLVIAERTQHSKKPKEVRNRIQELFGDLPRIELFARQKTPGWDVWGNEV